MTWVSNQVVLDFNVLCSFAIDPITSKGNGTIVIYTCQDIANVNAEIRRHDEMFEIEPLLNVLTQRHVFFG